MIFNDRREAGRELGSKLLTLNIKNTIVLALVRGGVPVGFEVARALGSPLHALVVRKIGAPQNLEFGIGAIAEEEKAIYNISAVSQISVPTEELRYLEEEKTAEIKEKISLYRGGEPLPKLSGKKAIIVDDGLATGITALAAIKAVRKLNPQKIILATPIGAQSVVEKLRKEVDDIVCLYMPENLEVVGVYYHHFEQVSDEEVIKFLVQRSS